jgi:hypothetical protein
MSFKIANPYDTSLKVVVSLSPKSFMSKFMEICEELEEFVMPNTSFEQVVSRFKIQGFWSGNKYRIYFEADTNDFYAENRW